MLQTWSEITFRALQGLLRGFLDFVPGLFAAVVVFIVGWFVAVLIEKIIAEVLRKIKFNQIFEKGNWDEALAKANIKVDASGFLAAIVKWVLIIVFIQVAVGILGWVGFANILAGVVNYLPNVVVAALVFVITVIISDIVEKVIRAAVEKTRVGYGHLISVIVKWAIWIFAIVIILDQLKIGGILPEAVIFAIIGAFALAVGLAFGLGGREAAAELIADLKKKASQK